MQLRWPVRNGLGTAALPPCPLCRFPIASTLHRPTLPLPFLAPAWTRSNYVYRQRQVNEFTNVNEKKYIERFLKEGDFSENGIPLGFPENVLKEDGHGRRRCLPVSCEFDPHEEFTIPELEIAQRSIRLQKRNAAALEILTAPKGTRRLPSDLTPLLTSAVSGLEAEIRALSAHIEAVTYARHANRFARGMIRYLLSNGRGHDAIHARWDRLKSYAFVLRHVMVYLLLYKSNFRLAARILGAIGVDFRFRASVLEQVYKILVESHFENVPPYLAQSRAVRLMELCFSLMRPKVCLASSYTRFRRRFPLSQFTIYTLVQNLPVERVNEWYWTLRRSRNRVKGHTIYHIVNRLCKPIQLPDGGKHTPYWREAWRILNKATQWGLNVRTAAGKRAFFEVFYAALTEGDQMIITDIARLMKAAGVANPEQDQRSVYIMMMKRAADRKDTAEVMKVFRTMQDAGYKPDAVTYAILHWFFKEIGDEDRRQAVQQAGAEQGMNDQMATDILHTMFLKKAPFKDVLMRYASYFELGPLLALGLMRHGELDMYRTRYPMKWARPDHVTLAVMIASWCGANGATRRTAPELWRFYKYYHGIILSPKNSLHTRMLDGGVFIPQSIMLGFGRLPNNQGLEYTLKILQDLLHPRSAIKPHTHTWAIALVQLTKAQRMEEAEVLHTFMEQKGFKPNVVTWTTLIRGYLEIEGGDADAGNTLKRMLASGVQASELTMDTIALSKDRKAFMEGAGLEDTSFSEGSPKIEDMSSGHTSPEDVPPTENLMFENEEVAAAVKLFRAQGWLPRANDDAQDEVREQQWQSEEEGTEAKVEKGLGEAEEGVDVEREQWLDEKEGGTEARLEKEPDEGEEGVDDELEKWLNEMEKETGVKLEKGPDEDEEEAEVEPEQGNWW